MNRESMLRQVIGNDRPWDMVVVGGGATGSGIALDAAARGYRILLLEQDDFSKGTSSRSTKLAHGGVRYLQQGNLTLVLEALHERGLMIRNAPHLVHNLPFVVPNYDWWEAPFYGIGLKLYSVLAGRHNLGETRLLSRDETLERIPTIETNGLRGGVIYHDGQFDDSRFVIALLQTAVEQGAVALNYMKVTGLTKTDGFVDGVTVHDEESGANHELRARAVINATGPFSDALRRLDDPNASAFIRPSQGVHIVIDRRFLPGDNAIMVPHTDDGRVMFAIPWQNRVIVGTTDTPVHQIPLEPIPLKEEVDFLVGHAARYLSQDPTHSDVLSVFAGIRPLVGPADDNGNTAAISRDHTIAISHSGLVTIAGGKWTTYRRMAEETVDHAAVIARLDEQPCVTSNLNIHGYHTHSHEFGELAEYGSDAPDILALAKQEKKLGERLHSNLPVIGAQIVWAVREEMARSLEDVLARRTRSLLLDAKASLAIAPKVAEIMSKEMKTGKRWAKEQVSAYEKLVENYLPPR
ncbi:MAG: glycerol-3-phosphate dehydrogenase/oxidase [bacterium]